MMVERVSISGLRELGASFKKLKSEVALKIGRRAVNKGAQVIKKLVIAKAPVAPKPYRVDDGTPSGQIVQPKNIQRNVVIKRVPKSELTAESVVAIRGKRKNGYANRIASLGEFGTVKQAAKPFVRPAFEEGKVPAAEAIVKELKKGIEKAAKQ